MAATQTAPSASARPQSIRRTGYRHFRETTTRWMDNDVLGHVNNVAYLSFFDSTITSWFLSHGFLNPAKGPLWMVAENGCRYLSEVAFPDALTVGMRLGRLGTSSVRWELALFRGDADEASADGFYVHVHVDPATRRPMPIPDHIRQTIIAELDHGHRT